MEKCFMFQQNWLEQTFSRRGNANCGFGHPKAHRLTIVRIITDKVGDWKSFHQFFIQNHISAQLKINYTLHLSPVVRLSKFLIV